MWWGYWRDYPKVRIGTRDYAQIGDRLYTHHAVDYMLPSGRRTVNNLPVAQGEGGGYLTKGRGIPPKFVEEAILHGETYTETVKGIRRTIHLCGDLKVVTEENGGIVVTIRYQHEE